MSYKKFYGQFLKGHGDLLHMTCHSHHFWPDVTREAMLEYWQDSATYSDHKWDIIFGKKIPQLQKEISKQLDISNPESIVIASSTHDLLVRLLSSLDYNKKIHILTTDGEFHSFSRQIKRLEETSRIQVTRLSSEPKKFWNELDQKLEHNFYDFIFVSHVFFNSGISFGNIDQFVEKCQHHGKIVIDAYHSYFALPISLKNVQERIFFMAGHYKYAGSGEGLCFMVCPPGEERPLITGWFAEFEALKSKNGEVTYPNHAGRFLGSTMDFTALYRSLSVYNLFEQEQITVEKIHNHVQILQKRFLEIIKDIQHPVLSISNLLHEDFNHQGHFLAFKFTSDKECEEFGQKLEKIGIRTDWRGQILRFGFSLYQEVSDLERIYRIKDL